MAAPHVLRVRVDESGGRQTSVGVRRQLQVASVQRPPAGKSSRSLRLLTEYQRFASHFYVVAQLETDISRIECDTNENENEHIIR